MILQFDLRFCHFHLFFKASSDKVEKKNMPNNKAAAASLGLGIISVIQNPNRIGTEKPDSYPV